VSLQVALIGYDLTASPTLNTLPGADIAAPAERGIVLYPEANRAAQRYWILPEKSKTLSGCRPEQGFVSPIAWSLDSQRLAVVDHEAEENRLVIVDISRGLRDPFVTMAPVAREAFLQPRFSGAVPRESADSYAVFQELTFSEDGRSVVLKSWGQGPFAEKTVALPVPPANR
jgi:hypothetical protein